MSEHRLVMVSQCRWFPSRSLINCVQQRLLIGCQTSFSRRWRWMTIDLSVASSNKCSKEEMLLECFSEELFHLAQLIEQLQTRTLIKQFNKLIEVRSGNCSSSIGLNRLEKTNSSFHLACATFQWFTLMIFRRRRTFLAWDRTPSDLMKMHMANNKPKSSVTLRFAAFLFSLSLFAPVRANLVWMSVRFSLVSRLRILEEACARTRFV